jgi:tRNA nucleotidyltransferase (CCA-adding enzyme)
MAELRVDVGRLTSAVREVLAIATQVAQEKGWQLYLVGGGVRDLLRSEENGILLTDLDLVVDGVGSEGAGVTLAQGLRSRYPEAQLTIHKEFQTAALVWGAESKCGTLMMDLATARTETYAYAGANPVVKSGSIETDLRRRDFTVNAMALRLTEPGAGEVLDFYGGATDLAAGVLRVLHPDSFIDDPTRIFRGARFAARLGFEFEAGTRELIREAIESGIYEKTLKDNSSVPALQTRLRAEMKYLLNAPEWKKALRILRSVDAFYVLDPSLVESKRLNERQWRVMWRSLCRMDVWLRNAAIADSCGIDRWQLLLELILMVADHAVEVTDRMQLPGGAIDRGQRVLIAAGDIEERLDPEDSPSRVDEVLSRYGDYGAAMLWLVAARMDDPWRCQIWTYLRTYMTVKPMLSGKDLQALGIPAGRGMKGILARLRSATLDGVVTDRESAIVFLREEGVIDR